MLSSAGYWIFSHPEICCGDQSRISLLATSFRSFTWMARRHRLGRKAESRLGDPLPGLDTQGGLRGVRLPGLPSTPRAPDLWLYCESTNPKRALEKCPLAQRQ